MAVGLVLAVALNAPVLVADAKGMRLTLLLDDAVKLAPPLALLVLVLVDVALGVAVAVGARKGRVTIP